MTEVLGASSSLDFLTGGGEMGALIRAKDWSATPLGPIECWPIALRTTIATAIVSPFPMVLAWGQGLVTLYNDAYRPLLGTKPALGCSFLEVWAEARGTIAPLLERAFAGEACRFGDASFTLLRQGEPETAFFDFALSPVRDENGVVVGILHIAFETTTRVLAQQAQREAEHQWTEAVAASRLSADFQTLFEASPTPFLVVAPPDWTIVAANDARLRVTGTTREEQIGRRLFDAFPDDPNDPNADGVRNLTASLERVVATRSTDTMAVQRYAVRGVDGRFVERWWAPANSPVLNKDGEVALIIHRVEEVTELVRLRGDAEARDQLARDQQAVIDRLRASEAALRESEARFRLTADAVPQIIWITDRHGRMEFLNRRFVEYTGAPLGRYEPAEMVANFIHEQDGAKVVAAFKAALETGESFEVEHRIRSAAGEDRWFIARAEPHRNPETGEIVRWFGSSVDIHDRKMAEAALRQSEARHRFRAELGDALRGRATPPDIMAAVAEGLGPYLGVDQANYYLIEGAVFIVTNEWRTSASPGLLGRHALGDFGEGTIAGLRAGKTLRLNDTRETEDAAAYAAASMFAVLSVPLRRDGRWAAGLHVHRAQPCVWSDEEMALVQEVAERAWAEIVRVRAEAELRDSEARLRELNETLESRVVQRTVELEQAHEQLRQSQKLEAMGSLTGGVAHDFNNLLTPIIGSLDMLVRRGIGSERERRLVNGALQSADRAKTLVQRLLAFARRQPLQPSAVDLGALIADMAGLIGSTLGPTIDVQIALADNLPRAEADPNQVEMALLNLVVNSRDAMPDGGRLTIEARCERVHGRHRTTLQEGHYVLISVADTGVGMDEATRSRAVEPFFSTKGIGKGTGLGLSMVHGLAAQLHGALLIDSAPGQGAIVELWLPVSLTPVDAEDRAPNQPIARPRRGKALLVDDEELVRLTMADMLMDLGFEVTEAGSAEEALRLIEQGEKPDLLVTDHLMSGMNGADLARTLRTRTRGLPVLIVSGYAEVDGIAPDLPRLTKPFRNAELAERIASLNL